MNLARADHCPHTSILVGRGLFHPVRLKRPPALGVPGGAGGEPLGTGIGSARRAGSLMKSVAVKPVIPRVRVRSGHGRCQQSGLVAGRGPKTGGPGLASVWGGLGFSSVLRSEGRGSHTGSSRPGAPSAFWGFGGVQAGPGFPTGESSGQAVRAASRCQRVRCQCSGEFCGGVDGGTDVSD